MRIGHRPRLIGTPAPEEPTFTATLDEKATIKRFLDFALADIDHQSGQIEQENPSDRAHIQFNNEIAAILRGYIGSLKSGVDQMMQIDSSPFAKQTEH